MPFAANQSRFSFRAAWSGVWRPSSEIGRSPRPSKMRTRIFFRSMAARHEEGRRYCFASSRGSERDRHPRAHAKLRRGAPVPPRNLEEAARRDCREQPVHQRLPLRPEDPEPDSPSADRDVEVLVEPPPLRDHPARDVCDNVPEPVHGQDLAPHARTGRRRRAEVQPHVVLDRGPQVRELRALREMGGDRGEDVPPVEDVRGPLQHVGPIREVADLFDPERVRGGDQQSVVGPDEQRALAGDRDRAAGGPDARVYDADVDCEREVRSGGGNPVRTLAGGLRGHGGVQVDDRGLRVDLEDHALHRRDVWAGAEVCREGDDHAVRGKVYSFLSPSRIRSISERLRSRSASSSRSFRSRSLRDAARPCRSSRADRSFSLSASRTSACSLSATSRRSSSSRFFAVRSSRALRSSSAFAWAASSFASRASSASARRGRRGSPAPSGPPPPPPGGRGVPPPPPAWPAAPRRPAPPPARAPRAPPTPSRGGPDGGGGPPAPPPPSRALPPPRAGP